MASIQPVGITDIKADRIDEITSNAGVTIDSVLLKDGGATLTAALTGTTAALSGAVTVGSLASAGAVTGTSFTGNHIGGTIAGTTGAFSGALTAPSATISGTLSAGSITGVTWTTWSPTYTPAGGMTFTGVTTDYAKYFQIGKLVFYSLRVSGTIGGVLNNGIYFSAPVTIGDIASCYANSARVSNYNGPGISEPLSAANIWMYRGDLSNYTAGGVTIWAKGFYEAA